MHSATMTRLTKMMSGYPHGQASSGMPVKVHAVPARQQRQRQEDGRHHGEELHDFVLPDADLRLIQLPDLQQIFAQAERVLAQAVGALAAEGEGARLGGGEGGFLRRVAEVFKHVLQLRAIARQRRYLLAHVQQLAAKAVGGQRRFGQRLRFQFFRARFQCLHGLHLWGQQRRQRRAQRSARRQRPPEKAVQHALYKVALVANGEVSLPEGEGEAARAAFHRPNQRRALRAGAAVARLRRQKQAHERGQMDGLQFRGREQTHFPAPHRRALAAGKAALCAIQTHRVSLLAPLWYHAAVPLSMRVSFTEKQLSALHV